MASSEKQQMFLTRPPKPISEMTHAERRAYAQQVIAAAKEKFDKPADSE